MFDIDKFNNIKGFIAKSGQKSQIIAISKNHNTESINKAISGGVSLFGENRVQEAKLKFESILKTNQSIKLHLTGPLQTNKVKQALGIFDVFHTIDREKLVKELSKFPEKIKNKSFFVQVNTGKELSKSGIYPEHVKEFLDFCNKYGLKNILGLMCIPPIEEDPKKHFRLITDMSKNFGFGGASIGMSSDYLDALEFNPSYIRLGTILFGKRE